MFETTYMRCVYKGKATFLSDSLMFLKASSVRVFFPGSVMNRPKKKKKQLIVWVHSLSYTWQLSSSTILKFVSVLIISYRLMLR